MRLGLLKRLTPSYASSSVRPVFASEGTDGLLRGCPFLVLAAFVRGGGACQGSTVVDRVAALALTGPTTTFTTIAGEEGGQPFEQGPSAEPGRDFGSLACLSW